MFDLFLGRRRQCEQRGCTLAMNHWQTIAYLSITCVCLPFTVKGRGRLYPQGKICGGRRLLVLSTRRGTCRTITYKRHFTCPISFLMTIGDRGEVYPPRLGRTLGVITFRTMFDRVVPLRTICHIKEIVKVIIVFTIARKL